MWIGGSATGNVVRIRVDVREETAGAIEDLVADEPPMGSPDSAPVHLAEYEKLLAAEAPVEEVSHGITYTFPSSLRYENGARIVSSHTPEGAQLLARLQREGMPEGLAGMGFTGVDDFWPPWCVAVDEGMIASVAFTARLSSLGAEVGVATPPASRGRGFAAATTAAWATLPALVGHVLFYGTNATNVSSQRVADRLRLPFVGPSLSIR